MARREISNRSSATTSGNSAIVVRDSSPIASGSGHKREADNQDEKSSKRSRIDMEAILSPQSSDRRQDRGSSGPEEQVENQSSADTELGSNRRKSFAHIIIQPRPRETVINEDSGTGADATKLVDSRQNLQGRREQTCQRHDGRLKMVTITEDSRGYIAGRSKRRAGTRGQENSPGPSASGISRSSRPERLDASSIGPNVQSLRVQEVVQPLEQHRTSGPGTVSNRSSDPLNLDSNQQRTTQPSQPDTGRSRLSEYRNIQRLEAIKDELDKESKDLGQSITKDKAEYGQYRRLELEATRLREAKGRQIDQKEIELEKIASEKESVEQELLDCIDQFTKGLAQDEADGNA